MRQASLLRDTKVWTTRTRTDQCPTPPPRIPILAFLDPTGLSATPYIYLIPVGVDSMRSPPLGDQSEVRTWAVNDVTIPLPFNIGGSDFSTKALYQSSDSLSEPLFNANTRPFRPVSSSALFSWDIYSAQEAWGRPRHQRTLRSAARSGTPAGRSSSRAGRRRQPREEGLDRFLQTVKDVRIHLVTYSYSGN